MATEKKAYLVLFIDVESGEVEDAWSSYKIGDLYETAQIVTPSDSEDGTMEILWRKTTNIVTYFNENSPGCRYVNVGGVLKKVCT